MAAFGFLPHHVYFSCRSIIGSLPNPDHPRILYQIKPL
ncbi:hypothetical protein HMPREF1051_0295 [Neisseria sicca VK64]|uniref:Uncharacterized protein n=1 Tax=Neisseria sicca VK64 TaxID=1095748 RepID=I2NRI1_NEISI|nr:hypothetical protein HMPREF1051_0295 [Neisseria sicca VK64]